MQLQGIIPMLGVREVEQSLRFYVQQLGFVMVGDYVEDEVRWWAHVRRDQAELMLSRWSHPEEWEHLKAGHAHVIFYVYADDVRALHRDLEAAGVEVTELRTTFYRMVEFTCTDPDGYQVWFGQRDEEKSGE